MCRDDATERRSDCNDTVFDIQKLRPAKRFCLHIPDLDNMDLLGQSGFSVEGEEGPKYETQSK
jgi:hypothetical protein